MAMEDRQRQIKEGAGLEESRLNKEFIEMLSKWGPYFFIGVAILAGGYALYQKYERDQATARDTAYVSLNAASIAQNPDTLAEIARESSGTAIPLISAMAAADIHLSAARTGIPIGEKLGQDGKLPEGKAFLTDEQRAQELAKAEELYKLVVGKGNGSAGQESFVISSLTGLASISEDRGKVDEATNYYNQAIAKAEALKFTHLAGTLKERLASLPKLNAAPKLLTNAELPGAGPVNPTIVPLNNFTATTTDGSTLSVPPPTLTAPGNTTITPPQPISITPAPAPTPTPAPAPAPAPTEPKPADPAKPG